MPSCELRADERDKTVPQLAAFGLEPKVYLDPCNPATALGNRRQAQRIVRDAEGELLFVEDDVDFKPSFPRWLELARERGVITLFCVLPRVAIPTNVRHAWRRSGAIRPDLYPLNVTGSFYGVQCVYFPASAVEKLKACPVLAESKMEPFDLYLRGRHRQLGGLWGAFPNPVQHRSPESVRHLTGGETRRSVRRSDTYDVPESEPLEA